MLKTAHWLDTGRKAADSPRLPVQLQQRGCTWPIHSGESCKLPRIVTIFKSREVHTDLQVWKNNKQCSIQITEEGIERLK